MNKKGQAGVVTVLFSLLVFFILYSMFFGAWLRDWCVQAVNTGNFGAIESFIILNLNILIPFVVLIAAMVLIYYGE